MTNPVLTALAPDLRDEVIAQLVAALRFAHDTLIEINPSNYGHDEVCEMNAASVQVILSIAPLLSETHGKTPEWWKSYAAAKAVMP